MTYDDAVGNATKIQWFMEAEEVWSRAENFHRRADLERSRAKIVEHLTEFAWLDGIDRLAVALGAMCRAVAAVRNGAHTRSVNMTNACAGEEGCWCDECTGWRQAREANAWMRRHVEESNALVDKLTGILDRVAVALKGEPDELTMHGWSDLPELAAAAVARANGTPAIAAGEAGLPVDQFIYQVPAAATTAPAPKPVVCSTCNDSHVMTLPRGDVMCTRCPVPCVRCRGGFTAYCAETPCSCACHAPKSAGGGR